MNQSNMQIDLKNIEGIKNFVDEGGYDIEKILSVLIRINLGNGDNTKQNELDAYRVAKLKANQIHKRFRLNDSAGRVLDLFS